MVKYLCEMCNKNFKQKSDFDKHKKKKTPCISMNEIEKLTKTKEIINDNKANLTTIFKHCLDVLRDSEHLTGDKALRTLAHLLDLRLLEPQFGKTIDIDEYNYDFSHIDPDNVERHKKKLLEIVRFSKLVLEKEDNIPTNMKYLWDDILAVHPKTKNIFLKGKGFDITNQSTYKKLLTKLNNFDFESIEADILGEAYEEVIQDVMIGRTLGQFFTPPKVKKVMVKLTDPQVNNNGTIEKIFDPAMGTGGFLITCLRHLINQSKTKNIKLDWDFIRKEGLGGREAEPDTYQLAVSNMLISSGQMFDVLEKGDSIRSPITNKYDIILANPPFGIDGLLYDDITCSLRNEYLPIKSNSAVPLFLQAIIYMLKVGGRCAVVLPEGQELFSKNNALVAVREFLMKTCDLKQVLYLPAGTFTHTSIKTCVFYFIKKKECSDVLQTNIKLSKNNKETAREYKFTKTLQTSKVHFYDYNPDNDVKHELIDGGVSIDAIVNNHYSLNYAEYLKDNAEDEVYEDGIVVKTLGDVCEFLPKSKRNAKYGKDNGLYPFFKSSMKIDNYVDIPDYTEESIIIGDGGEPNINYGIKFSTSDHCYILQNINKLHNNLKYIYYYLFHNLNSMSKLYTGVAIKNISKINISNIKIPIPSLEKQKEIVSYLDFIYEKCNKTSNDKIDELKKLNEFCLNNQKVFGDNEMKTLGDVCEFKNGKGIKKENLIIGNYPVIGGGQNPMGLHNEYNTNENVILCSSSGAYAGYISKYDKKVWASDCFSIIPKNKLINNTYLYFTLKLSLQNKIYKSQTGTAQPHIYSKNLINIKIPIPSLEIQKEIIEYCDFNSNLIQQLEKEIEQNKTQANQFLSNIIKHIPLKQDELSDNNFIDTEELEPELGLELELELELEQEQEPEPEPEPNSKPEPEPEIVVKVIKKKIKKNN